MNDEQPEVALRAVGDHPPTIYCVPKRSHGRFFVSIRCPHCGNRHQHGFGDDQATIHEYAGHRVAHCHRGTGYNLIPVEDQEQLAATLRAVRSA